MMVAERARGGVEAIVVVRRIGTAVVAGEEGTEKDAYSRAGGPPRATMAGALPAGGARKAGARSEERLGWRSVGPGAAVMRA